MGHHPPGAKRPPQCKLYLGNTGLSPFEKLGKVVMGMKAWLALFENQFSGSYQILVT